MIDKPSTKRKSCCEKFTEYFRGPRKESADSQQKNDIVIMNLLPLTSSRKKLLLLDLDETLVYSSVKEIHSSEFQIKPVIDNQERQYFVSVREGARQFIERMNLFFEIGVFTASPQAYADLIIKNLDQEGIISLKFYKDDCTLQDSQRIKDLSRIGVDLKNVMLIDDQVISFNMQPQNGLLIKAYTGKRQDRVLENLIPILEKMHSLDDLRPVQQNYQIIRENMRVTSRNGSYCISPNIIQCGSLNENEPSPLKIRKSQNSIPNSKPISVLTPIRTFNKTVSQYRLNIPSPDKRKFPNKRSAAF